MRLAFAQYATLLLGPVGDERALGAAITQSLCGHWEHEPPCPLAPHHTQTERCGDVIHLRTLFAVEPELEEQVRQQITLALQKSLLVGPDGATTTWHLRDSERGNVRPEDVEHAERLVRLNSDN